MKFIRYAAWLMGLASCVLYVWATAPTIVTLFDDSLEFQLVGPTFGIAHPTGYPLYVLLGGVWSRLMMPFGNWAWRMNLFSALCAATAVGGLAWLSHLIYQCPSSANGQPAKGLATALAAMTAAAAFGLSPIWWSQATVAEVYALHILLITLMLGLCIQVGRRAVRPVWLFLCMGLALTHHRTTVLLFPGLLLYLAWCRPELFRPQAAWGRWLVALLAPLLLYLYIPLRAAMGIMDLNGSYVNTWRGFWQHVLASGYTTFLGDNALSSHKTGLDWLALFQAQLGLVGLGLALLGLWPMQRRWRKEGLLLLMVLACNLLFVVVYQTPDVEVFTLPITLCISLLIGAASLQAASWLARLETSWFPSLGQMGLLLLVALGVGGRAPLMDRSQEWAAHDYAVALAKVDYPPQSHVVGLEGEITALHYMQKAEGLGTMATGMVADDPTMRRQVVAELVEDGLPTYLTRELDGIAPHYSFSAAGPLVRVWPRGQTEIASPQSLSAPFVNGDLLLTGVETQILQQAGGPTLFLALSWQPQTALTQQLKVSLRLLDEQGQVLRDADGQRIQHDLFPLLHIATTETWVPGVPVQDNYYLPLPPGRYTNQLIQPTEVLLILYDAATTVEVGRWRMWLP